MRANIHLIYLYYYFIVFVTFFIPIESQGSLAEAPQAAYGTLDQITEGSLRQVFSGPQLLFGPVL